MHASLARAYVYSEACTASLSTGGGRGYIRLSGFSYRPISSCKFQWRGNGDVAGVRSNRRWNGAKRHIAGAIIYLRNVFIEYYAAQVGNLVHGYAINERRSERDTGGGGGRPRERLEVRGGDARGGIAGAETIIRGGVRGGGSGGRERERERARGARRGRRMENKVAEGGEESVGGGESRARVQEKERTTEGVIRR